MVTYLFFQALSLVTAIFYKTVLHPHRVSVTTRHLVATLVGLYIGFYSFSWSMFHLVVQSTVSYLMIKFLNPKYIHTAVFLFSMTYLSVEHIRQVLRNFSEDIDHVGPMMIVTEKVTSLAFGLHDGLTKDPSTLNKRQKAFATRRIPTVLEFYSYIFHFQALAVGPFSFYNQYIDFVEGRHLIPYKKTTKDGEVIVHKEPPVMFAVLGKLGLVAIISVVMLSFGKSYPVEGNLDESIMNSPMWYRVSYMMMSKISAQMKYFFGWILADAVCNASGFGFNGYDDNGVPQWDLVTNINFVPFLLATSLRESIDSWHIPTKHWLRYVCYDRVPAYKDVLTFLLTAAWHGFYPGYYWTIVNVLLILMAARKVRYNFRPFFIQTKPRKLFYDVMCWLMHRIVLEYITVPFVLLVNPPIVKFYSSMYFSGQIAALSLILVLPGKKTPTIKKDENKGVTPMKNGDVDSDSQNAHNASSVQSRTNSSKKDE
ncbi:lysophospholipid acyltransferase 2-like isoform X2 [Ptychodera flava]|uniref:lysophospholipid acyltransferase 2-like isoform X2 n=1 Tax=Ptychodera flava TaxID=63121 RepID=UPI00396A2814